MPPWLQNLVRPLALWNRRRLHRRQQRKRPPFDDWCRRHDIPNVALLDAIEVRVRGRLGPLPGAALWLRIGPEPLASHQAMWESLLRQRHRGWQASLAPQPGLAPATLAWWQQVAQGEPRLQLAPGGPGAFEAWLAAEAAPWCALLDPGEQWRPHTLLLLCEATALHAPQDDASVQAVFADEDCIAPDGRRHNPAFKGAFDPWALLTHDSLGSPVLWRTAHLRQRLKAPASGAALPDGAFMHALALRATAGVPTAALRHVPHVLAHRSEPRPWAPDAAAAAVKAHLQAQSQAASVTADPDMHAAGLLRVQFTLPAPPPRLSIVIPTRNGLALLRRCVDSIVQRSTWPHWNLLIVDNGSDDPACLRWLQQVQADPRIRVQRDERAFNFAALNNAAVAAVDGDFVALVNNDIEVISPDWMQTMVSLASQPGVGAVGARLWYGDDTLQHAGVVLGVGGGAGHVLKHLRRGDGGPRRRALHLQRYTAVTAACLVVRRQLYLDVGGMDEAYAVAFNDVDFCCRLAERGLHNLWTPQAEMFHHESISRGSDAQVRHRPRLEAELARLRQRWGPWLDADPANNPNLTLVHEDLSAAEPPRVSLARPWYGHGA